MGTTNYPSCTSTSNYYVTVNTSYTTSSTTGNYCPSVYYTRRMLVMLPRKWSRQTTRGFCDCISSLPSFGVKAELLIEGTVDVIDPDIEKRDFDDFINLLNSRGNPCDRDALKKFLAGAE